MQGSYLKRRRVDPGSDQIHDFFGGGKLLAPGRWICSTCVSAMITRRRQKCQRDLSSADGTGCGYYLWSLAARRSSDHSLGEGRHDGTGPAGIDGADAEATPAIDAGSTADRDPGLAKLHGKVVANLCDLNWVDKSGSASHTRRLVTRTPRFPGIGSGEV
jgi:hypothetical protein